MKPAAPRSSFQESGSIAAWAYPTTRPLSATRTMPLAPLCVTAVVLADAALKFKGTCAGTIAVTPNGDGTFSTEIVTEGHISRLGATTIRLTGGATLVDGRPVPVPPTEGVATAESGDTIVLRLTWDAREVEPGVYYVRGPFTANGGTGEFAGASGRGTYKTLIDTNTGQVTSQFKGRVE